MTEQDDTASKGDAPAFPPPAFPPPAYPPPAYPPPAYPPPTSGNYPPPYFAAQQTTNGLAIASLVLGIIGAWILSLIFGYVAKGQIDRSQGMQTGRGMAIAGIVLGWVGLALTILVVILLIVAASYSDTSY